MSSQQSSDLDDHPAKPASYFAEEELEMRPFPPGPRAGSGEPGPEPGCPPRAVHSAWAQQLRRVAALCPLTGRVRESNAETPCPLGSLSGQRKH